MYSPLTKQLIEALRCLPGIGPKSAQRMAYQLLTTPEKPKGLTLAKALQQAIQQVGHCKLCRNFTEHELCKLCNNQKREHNLLCVVEGPLDVIAIEQTNNYRGRYYVLHGHLSPLDGVGPNEVCIPYLLERIENESIKELIIATNPTIEGKATAHYIANHINHEQTKCTRIAYGVPIGGELEYLDGSTLSHAFYSRLPMNEVNDF